MARAAINKIADSRRLLGHAVFTPKRQGWMNEVDRAISTLKPDSWKGYTIGDPLFPSKMGSYWRLDDQKLMYPFYEKIVKAGITTRSEEHTSELQSLAYLVCRLLLEKKKKKHTRQRSLHDYELLF